MTTFSYGPFEKKSPFSEEELNVHFENNNKFLTVTRLERVIELLYSQIKSVFMNKNLNKK